MPYGLVRVPVEGSGFVAAKVVKGGPTVIILSHGNAEQVTTPSDFEFLLKLRDVTGCTVLGYDYRGYGYSSDAYPSVQKTVFDLLACVTYAVNALKAARVILVGQSIGTGPTCALASVMAPGLLAGVILLSPFSSVQDLVRDRVGDSSTTCLLPGVQYLYPNADNVERVTAPILVVHGEWDVVVPVSHGKRLVGRNPRWARGVWLPGIGHNDITLATGFWDLLANFVKECSPM